MLLLLFDDDALIRFVGARFKLSRLGAYGKSCTVRRRVLRVVPFFFLLLLRLSFTTFKVTSSLVVEGFFSFVASIIDGTSAGAGDCAVVVVAVETEEEEEEDVGGTLEVGCGAIASNNCSISCCINGGDMVLLQDSCELIGDKVNSAGENGGVGCC